MLIHLVRLLSECILDHMQNLIAFNYCFHLLLPSLLHCMRQGRRGASEVSQGEDDGTLEGVHFNFFFLSVAEEAIQSCFNILQIHQRPSCNH